jgi:invasion protein IalB
VSTCAANPTLKGGARPATRSVPARGNTTADKMKRASFAPVQASLAAERAQAMRCQNGVARVLSTFIALVALGGPLVLATSLAAIAQDTSPLPKVETQPKKPSSAPAPEPAPAGQPTVALVFSPWTKICGKDSPPANSKVVCLIVKEARVREGRPEIGPFAASAALVEAEDEPKKILRVILPLGMQIQPGTRLFIDQGTPSQRPYLICFAIGCMSDYDADPMMVSKLAKGQELIIQAIDASGQPLTVKLPLTDFAKAYEGPPIDPKVLGERQKRLQDEMQGVPKGNAGE